MLPVVCNADETGARTSFRAGCKFDGSSHNPRRCAACTCRHNGSVAPRVRSCGFGTVRPRFCRSSAQAKRRAPILKSALQGSIRKSVQGPFGRSARVVVAAELVDFPHDGLQRGFVGIGLVCLREGSLPLDRSCSSATRPRARNSDGSDSQPQSPPPS